MRRAEQKVMARSNAVARFGPDRTGTLVFTNGCFDVLHAGHVAYLEEARALGDALVVGVNSDASVRRLGKGPDRPYVEAEDRSCVIASLESVDGVVVFDEDTPLELITALQPDVLVKGGDYTPDQVVGRRVVEARGGRVTILPFRVGHSTTDLVLRIQGQSR